MRVTKRIKNLRASLNLSQVEFAKLFGVHPITVSNWERGKARPSKWQAGLMWAVERGPVKHLVDNGSLHQFGPIQTLVYLLR